MLKKLAVSALCAASLAAFAADETAPAEKEDQAVNEALEEEETAIVSAEFYINFDSRYISYGLVDNKSPILTPGGSLTFFDIFSLYCEAIFDTTKYGYRAGYGSRRFRYTELHPGAALSYSFSPEDFEWLPTTVDVSLDYMYEYHPNSKHNGNDPEGGWDKDTAFWTFTVELPDLWLEPKFYFERDVIRDKGTYLNLEIGHTFDIVEDTLFLRPSVSQGWGDQRRVTGYLGEVHYNEDEDVSYGSDCSSLMDTCFKLTATWKICDWLELSGYTAYYDYLFCGASMREDVRAYEATGSCHKTYNFVGGLSLKASF